MSVGAVGGVKRGCGLRVEGGLYAECGLSKYGKPVEEFLVCPPRHLNLERLGVAPLGVQLVMFPDGTFHIIDWVGSEHYPYVTDFVEEVRRFGLSRRLSPKLDLSRLTHESRIILLHARATIRNPKLLHTKRIGGDALGYDWNLCPKGQDHDHDEMCIGLCWEDVADLEKKGGEKLHGVERIGERAMPSFRYRAARLSNGVRVSHDPAVFAIFPISRFAVVRAKDGSHEGTLMRVEKKSRIPVVEVDS